MTDRPQASTRDRARRVAAAALLVGTAMIGVADPIAAGGDPVVVEPTGSSRAAVANAADEPDVLRELVFPVVGEFHYSDTYGACRSGCSRGHAGTDVMADKLTPLVAVRDARVQSVKTTATPDGSSGNYVFLEDDEGWQYWYIHVNNDSPGTDDGANPPEWVAGPGIERGARVEAGQLIGFVGDSGNAEGTAPHLHFEMHGPDGEVYNPYRSLRAAPVLDEVGSVSEDRDAPPTPEQAFVDALHADFIGREATSIERYLLVDRLNEVTTGDLIEEFVASDTWVEAIVQQYYVDTLGREADGNGAQYWADILRSGRTSADVAAYFYASEEYHDRLGGTDEAWLVDLFHAVLDRAPTKDERTEWLGVLDDGAQRDVVSFGVYQSVEARELRVDELYQRLLGRSAEDGGRDYWADVLGAGDDLALATYLAASPEYWDRAGRRAAEAREADTETPDGSSGSDEQDPADAPGDGA